MQTTTETHRARLLDSTNIVIGADTEAPGDIEHPVVRIWCYEGQCGLPHGGTAVGVPDTAQSLASIVRQAEAHWTECHA
jgi:hypothetical protein